MHPQAQTAKLKCRVEGGLFVFKHEEASTEAGPLCSTCPRQWILFLQFTKVRHRGLQKNATRAFTALALPNIYLCRSHLRGQMLP